MARRLGDLFLTLAMALAVVNLTWPHPAAFAQEGFMDAQGEARAEEAMRIYKQGSYEEAAELFAGLSVDYPQMTIFERNVGACYYHLKRPELAIANLRNYLSHRKAITANDKAVVNLWIEEMEALRADKQVTPLPVLPAEKPPALVLSATPTTRPPTAARPFYKTAWFWGGAAIVAAGAVTAVLFATRKTESNIPSTLLGNQGAY